MLSVLYFLGTVDSRRFHRVIPARIPPRRNDQRKYHVDKHYLAAQAKIIGEFGAKFLNNCSQYSMDSMNKPIISSSCPAVSRFHQPRGYMPIRDGTNHPDHDFPGGPGYKLEVNCYEYFSTRFLSLIFISIYIMPHIPAFFFSPGMFFL